MISAVYDDSRKNSSNHPVRSPEGFGLEKEGALGKLGACPSGNVEYSKKSFLSKALKKHHPGRCGFHYQEPYLFKGRSSF